MEAVDKAVSKAAERALLIKVLPDVLAGNFRSLGSPVVASDSADVPHRLLPDSVEECRPVRILTRRTHEETVWREQVG